MLFNAPTTYCKTCVRIVSTRRLQWKLDVGTWQHSKEFIILMRSGARLHKLRQLICSAELFTELCKAEWITDWPFESRIRSRPAANSLAVPYSDQLWTMARYERGLLLARIPYRPLNRPDTLCCRFVGWDCYLYSANTCRRTGFPIVHTEFPCTWITPCTWGTALKAGRSRVRFPMVSLEFYIDIILLAALWPWGWLSL
jgi:hypothetical protein